MMQAEEMARRRELQQMAWERGTSMVRTQTLRKARRQAWGWPLGERPRRATAPGAERNVVAAPVGAGVVEEDAVHVLQRAVRAG